MFCYLVIYNNIIYNNLLFIIYIYNIKMENNSNNESFKKKKISNILLGLSSNKNINDADKIQFEILNYIFINSPLNNEYSNHYKIMLNNQENSIHFYLEENLILLYDMPNVDFKKYLLDNIKYMNIHSGKPYKYNLINFFNRLYLYSFINNHKNNISNEDIIIINKNIPFFRKFIPYNKNFFIQNPINKIMPKSLNINNIIKNYKNHQKSMIFLLNNMLKYIYNNNINIKLRNDYERIINEYLMKIFAREYIKDDNKIIPFIFKLILNNVNKSNTNKNFLMEKFITEYKEYIIINLNTNSCLEKNTTLSKCKFDPKICTHNYYLNCPKE
jgi:hypothetical protein